VRRLDNWEVAALNAALGISWNPSVGGSKKAKDILGMKRNNRVKEGGQYTTQADARTYTPHATNQQIVTAVDAAERSHHDSLQGGITVKNTDTERGMQRLARQLWTGFGSSTSSTGVIPRATAQPGSAGGGADGMAGGQSNPFPHPPLPGPCAVGTGIRTKNAAGNPRPCTVGYYPPNPADHSSIPYRFYSTVPPRGPGTAPPVVGSVGGRSRKNKSRSPSRNMARRSSRRSTRRSSTRKASRKGSRKTRRSSRK